ncbi:MAG: EamA family transporter [Chloroflexi bacterium]|nr:EamA family transporter [Chloroflexota bacterium]
MAVLTKVWSGILPAVWILLAICSAASLGFANIAHKRLLDNYLDGVGVLGVGSILTRLTCGGIMVAVVGWPTDASWQVIGMALLSGVSLGTGLLLLFLGLKLGEASRAVAVSQTNPILVALLALAILGEAVGPWQWTAIALVVCGAVLVSVEGLGRGLFRLTPGLTALMGSSAGLGMSFFLAKLVLSDLTPWEVFTLQELGMVPVFALFGRPANWRKLYSGLRSWPALTTFLVGEGLLPQLAILLFVWSFAFGPVSLASAILATRPMFVFLAGSLLSWRRLGLMQESLGTSALAAKFVAIVMIVAGTILLAVA